MNDYLEEFEELQQKDTFRGQQWRNERGRLVREYSWAVPNKEVLDYLGAFDAEPPDNCYTDVETALVCERGK